MPKPDVTKNQKDYQNHDSEKWRPVVQIVGWAIVILCGIWGFCYINVGEEKRVEIFLAISVNALILMAMFVQVSVAKRQWQAMRDSLQHAKDTLEIVERPLILVISVDTIDDWYPKLIPEITIENAGRTTAQNIRLKFGVAQVSLGGKFEEYPGHASETYWYGFLTSGGQEAITYEEADRVTVKNLSHPPGHELGGEVVIYGCGTYEGMGSNQYTIPIFAFRAKRIPSRRYGFTSSWLRDDRLAYEWESQKKQQEDEKPN